MSLSEMLGTGSVEKAKFSSPDFKGKSDFELECRFNPSSLKIQRKRTWSDGKQFKAAYPSLQYGGVTHDVLSFQIVLDETEPHDLSDMAAAAAALNPVMNLGPMASMMGLVNEDSVEEQLAVLYRLTTPLIILPDEPGGTRPPLATFTWNNFAFTGAITDLTVNIVLFDAEGNPKRAKVDVTIQGRLNWDGDITVEKGKSPDAVKPKSG